MFEIWGDNATQKQRKGETNRDRGKKKGGVSQFIPR